MEANKIFFIALFISLLTFILGLFIGYFFNRILFESIYYDYENVKNKVDSLKLLLEEERTCDLSKFYFIGRNLDELGSKIAFLQESKPPFISKEQFMLLKSQYFNLQYIHYILSKKLIEECHVPINVILYFYDDSIKCDDCIVQGYRLSLIKSKYSDKVMIYSFDLSYKNAFIEYFKEIYNIDKVPTIIIMTPKYTEIYRGLIDSKEIEKELSV